MFPYNLAWDRCVSGKYFAFRGVTHVLESLLNMRLIEAARSGGSAARHDSLPDVRYRIRRPIALCGRAPAKQNVRH